MKLLICSVIFPASMKYFGAFLHSVREQTNLCFDLLLVNDGVDLKGYSLSNITVLNAAGTILENRKQTIEYALHHSYDYIAWQDSDDLMMPNRVESIHNCVSDKYDILIHDLCLVDEQGNEQNRNFIGDRVRTGPISYDNIKFYNFAGFGNSIVKVSCLTDIVYPKANIQAIDWWLISFLLNKGFKAYYIGKVLGKYRQYDNNFVSFKPLDVFDYRKKRKAILAHYEALISFDADYLGQNEGVSNYILKLQEYENPDFDEETALSGHPMWWEDVWQLINNL